MKYTKNILFSLFLLIVSNFAQAQGKKVNVVCTLPTLKALTQEVGGDRVDVISLARGDQDPHFVSPTPVLMKKTREAALLIENGISLELWGDEVANGSGNSKIFRGNPGRVVASKGIPTLEVPSVLTREMGDIHPQGNPHVWLDPLLAKVQATNIAEALKAADPEGASYYESRKKDFHNRIDNALFGPELLKLVGIQKLTRLAASGELHNFLQNNKFGGQPLSAKTGGWLKTAEKLRGAKAYEFHKVWVYFARIFGMQLMGTIEERPGIPPGPQHVRDLTTKIQNEKIPLILVDNFYDPALPRNIASKTGSKVVVLPNQVEGEPGITTYFQLIDHIIQKTTGVL
ncbi:metal ABC transporter substrate-binding protein [bacterium]|nr:metal ABC transporter substrate-binding protein [bacterium]